MSRVAPVEVNSTGTSNNDRYRHANDAELIAHSAQGGHAQLSLHRATM